MDKYIPREKLSKKARRKLDADRRGTWGAVNPVTRSVKNEKAYNRKKARREMDFHPGGPFGLALRYIILHDNLIEIPNLLVGAGPNQAYQQIAVGDGILKELFV